MNKQVEQIKAEIERWKKELRLSTSCEAKYRREMLDDISEFIESLQKEPVSEDLKEAETDAADEDMQRRQIMEESNDNRQLYSRIFRRGFKAGANLGYMMPSHRSLTIIGIFTTIQNY